MMNRFLITALITTGLGLGYAPIANSQTSDTAEVEFTGTLAADCTVSNIQNGTLGFSPDRTSVNSFSFEGGSNGSFDFSEGCGSITLTAESTGTQSLNTFGGAVAFPGGVASTFGIATSQLPLSDGFAVVRASGDNGNIQLPAGEYGITVTAVLTSN